MALGHDKMRISLVSLRHLIREAIEMGADYRHKEDAKDRVQSAIVSILKAHPDPMSIKQDEYLLMISTAADAADIDDPDLKKMIIRTLSVIPPYILASLP